MQSVEGETRPIMFDLSVTVGAGLPNNRAYRYSMVRQAYADKAISKKEYRRYLVKQLGLNIQEIPESQEEQQELGIYDQNQIQQQEQITQNSMQQNANIEGINANGNVMPSYMKGV